MKTLKLTAFLTLLLFATSQIYSQNRDLETEKETVLEVMKSYKDALQNLTTEGTFELFTKDSKVFESGGVEGTYSHYIEHHLGPELGHFKSFTFSDYEIDVQVDAPYAFTTETYVYTIVLNPDDKGKIIKTHSSSRNTK